MEDRPDVATSPRVAMLINSLQRGGAETQFMVLARFLRESGYAVRIYTILPDNDFVAELDGLECRAFSAQPGLRTISSAARMLRSFRPAIVISFLYQASIIGRVIGRLIGAHVVVSSMRNERLEKWHRAVLFRMTNALDSATVVNSHAAARALRTSHTVSRRALRIIPNGLDARRFSADGGGTLRSELGLPEGVFLWLGIGRLSAQKDWSTLIEAISEYSGPPAHWAIAGAGEQMSMLAAKVRDAGLTNEVSWLGLRDDVPNLLRSADALVLSSKYEGLPNVVLEAMSAGRPVVATDVGGCAELVGTDYGALVAPGDRTALARAMARVGCLSRQQRDAMGRGARAHVAEAYSIETALRGWHSLLRELNAVGAKTTRR